MLARVAARTGTAGTGQAVARGLATAHGEGEGQRPRPRRVRQHVNPLAAHHQRPLALAEDWVLGVVDNPALPFWVDVGCSGGGFACAVAQHRPDINVLGLEIREPQVVRALERKRSLNLGNVHFEHCNANTSLALVASRINHHSHIARFLVQMPDPWFKKRHAKRRVLTPALAAAMHATLAPDGVVFVQSDVHEVALQMREVLRETAGLEDATGEADAGGLFECSEGLVWRALNPNAVPTEREAAVLGGGGAVFRALFVKRGA